jgi:hypothetical protein
VLPEIYRTLVPERGWTVDQYETWLAGTLIRQLDHPARRGTSQHAEWLKLAPERRFANFSDVTVDVSSAGPPGRSAARRRPVSRHATRGMAERSGWGTGTA